MDMVASPSGGIPPLPQNWHQPPGTNFRYPQVGDSMLTLCTHSAEASHRFGCSSLVQVLCRL